MPVPLHLAQEAARYEERRGEVLTQRLLPPLERELPHRDVLPRPDAVYRDADVDAPKRRAHLVEHALDLRLDREVGTCDRSAAELSRERKGALLAAVVMHDEPRALGRERACARRADPTRATGDQHPLPMKARLDAA